MQTTLDGNTATISQHASTLNGLSAEYVLRLNNNGHVSGLVLRSDIGEAGAPVSEAAFVVDTFRIVTPGGAGVAPFYVYNGVVYLDTARIRDLSANVIRLDGATLTADENGNLLVNDEGVGRAQLARGSATDFIEEVEPGEFLVPSLVWTEVLKINLGAMGLGERFDIHASGFTAKKSGTDGYTGSLRVRRRVKIGGSWSTPQQIDRSVNFSDPGGDWDAWNLFELFGGKYDDVEYVFEARWGGNGIPTVSHKDFSLSAQRRAV